MNGELAVSSGDITIRPMDIRPCLNYIGRSQFVADPMFKGSIDDFRVYNYELSAEDIKKVAQGESVGIITPQISDDELFIGPLPADQKLQVTYTPAQSSVEYLSVFIICREFRYFLMKRLVPVLLRWMYPDSLPVYTC